jgi:apolipoprotein D and lipocalin family protein
LVGPFSDALGLALKGDKTLNTLPRRPLLILLLSALVCGCTGLPEGVEPVRPFDLQRYKGEWFEIMRLDHSFERGLTNVTATYTLRNDGSVGVLNKGFDRKSCRWKEADGRAVFQGAPDTASLSVTFFWPFAGGYHVAALDQQDYSWALISGPSKTYLWILARQPDLSADIRNHLVDKARSMGFPVDDLILVDHGKPICASDQPPPK